MSSALALAGVTAVLRDLLNDGLINHNVAGAIGTAVTVSVMPPDRVVPSNGSEASQLNLFLHKVTPNLGWRNERLPARDSSGRVRLSDPPLALDLHYLLTAFTAADLHSEILLGYGMQLLHENPVLTREAIRTALSPAPDVGTTLPATLRALNATGLADQIEQLRITSAPLDTEELSKLWTAIQAHYRPTTAYTVSVVLIESTKTGVSPLPVLSRGPVGPVGGRERGIVVRPDLVPPLPTIETVEPAGKQPVARLGDTIDLKGHHLDGTNRQVRLISDRFGIDEVLAATVGNDPGLIQFVIPTARASDFPATIYQMVADVIRPGEPVPRSTNHMALVVAPHITNLPMNTAVDGSGTATFTIEFTPDYRAGQTVSLALGSAEVAAHGTSVQTASLDFVVPNAPLGNHLVRLRIDGIESPVVDRITIPPTFLDARIQIS
ncbi:DUF4255 domain-containing protein [Rhodococcus sp. T2V]|uniref:DUF4255 domain-containing protein n=1 Tax=Rhodococcus sp. T2V TaxID=3034164 RepID=UPI0023E1D841|nr:DUF4255 domain-containing protein [Rhodococcus sp. T2V]MDF3308908.1 DUF4255 domain-containing protein [Rhodococcus sp. T2V]